MERSISELNIGIELVLEIYGCPVLGDLTERRLHSFQNLLREQTVNGATLAEKRTKGRALGKLINSAQSALKRFKKGY